MPPTLRPATPADLTGVVRVFLACWQGYAAVLPADVVARMDLPTAQELWRTALDGGGVLVAVAPDPPAGGAADEVIGVTRWSLADDADGVGLIGSLYVDPGHQGGGCGARLLAAATDRLRERGSRTAILWVFADNAPARGFYSRQGWRPDGTERVDARFGARELRLTLDLGPAAGPDRHEGAG